MRFSLLLDINVHNRVVIHHNGGLTAVPTELLMVNDSLYGVWRLNDNKYHPLNAKVVKLVTKTVRESVKIISPPCYVAADNAFVYHKHLSRPINQLYKDNHGYGSIDALEFNPIGNDSNMRKKSLAFLNVKEPWTFYEVIVDVDYNGAFLFYGVPNFFPVPFVPNVIEETD